MARTIRFHLDESCDPRIAAGLRLLGVDVTTTPEAGLLHAPDEDQLAFAVSQGRAIISQDTGFLRIAASANSCYSTSYPPNNAPRRLSFLISPWKSPKTFARYGWCSPGDP